MMRIRLSLVPPLWQKPPVIFKLRGCGSARPAANGDYGATFQFTLPAHDGNEHD